MTDELKPVRCGCGGEAKVGCGYIASDTPYMVYCTKCKTVTKDYMTEAEAVEAWNRAMGERKTGKWIEYPDCLRYEGAYTNDQIACSECHHVFSILDNCTEEFDFCPSCGADMRGE